MNQSELQIATEEKELALASLLSATRECGLFEALEAVRNTHMKSPATNADEEGYARGVASSIEAIKKLLI